jgi:hypothetical protein
MTEVLSAQVPDFELESEPEATETREKTKTKLITAGALGAMGVAATFAETRGWVHGWPPPFHSLRHPWIGYYAAWAGDKVKRGRAGGAVAAGLAGNTLVESVQDVVNKPDHFPFHWADIPHQSTHENLDNLFDLACCMGGTALFLAQNSDTLGWSRSQLSKIRTRLSGGEVLAPVVEPE